MSEQAHFANVIRQFSRVCEKIDMILISNLSSHYAKQWWPFLGIPNAYIDDLV